MTKISELILSVKTHAPTDFSGESEPVKLVVSGDTSVRDVLRKMQKDSCDRIGISDEQNGNLVILSKEDVLHGLLAELDGAQGRLTELQQQIEGSLADQLDAVQQSAHALIECEKNKLQTAIENMTEGLMIMGSNGKVEKANPAARKLLVSKGEADLKTLTAELDRFGFGELVYSGSDDNEKREGEFTIATTDGRSLRMRWKAMIDEWNCFLGNVVMVHDVTDEMADEEAKTEFIAAISHELRTPLTSIQNSVSNIMAGVTGQIGEKTRAYLDKMRDDCTRFSDLINDLLDMAKLNAGSMPINRRVMNIVTTIRDTIAIFADEAKGRKIELVCEIVGRVSPVYADSQRIAQVLRNLLSNAVRFTERGRITVRAYDSEDNVVVVVEDTGIGISSKLQKQIFRKFYQIRRQAGAGSKGNGLGLAICSGIVAAHGGSIWVESLEGIGSKFYFTMPKTDPFIVLYKHLTHMAESVVKSADTFALLVVNFDVPYEKKEQLKDIIGSVINEILEVSDHFAAGKDNLAIQTEDCETVFVLKGIEKRRLTSIEQKIRKIVAVRLKKNWADAPIVPMLGTAIYPVDTSDIKELEKVARRTMKRMF